MSTSTLELPVTVDGMGGIPFVCRQDVVLRGVLQPVNGPVKIYVLPDATGKASSLDMMSAVVNPLSSATNFQIFKDGSAPLVNNAMTTSSLTFRGVLFAPETPLTINGGLWWAGSINVGQLKVNGAPNIKIGYDFDLDRYLGPDWRVSRYREIAPGEAFTSVPTTSTTSTTSTTAPPATTTSTTSTTSTTAPPATTTSTTSTSTSTTSTTSTTTAPLVTVPTLL